MLRYPHRRWFWLPLLIVALVAWPGTAAADGLATAPWPMHQHDARHSGRAVTSGPTQPQLAWYVTSNSDFTAGAVIGQDGTVFTAADNGTVRALSPDGKELWARAMRRAIEATPALTARGDLLVATRDGKLHALDVLNGNIKWSFDSGSDIVSSPAVAPDGSIAFGTEDGDLIVLWPDGSERNRHRSSGPIRSAPAIGQNNLVYWGADDRRAYAGTISGGLVWATLLDAPVEAGPVIGDDGTVYVAAGSLWALDAGSGAVKWQVPLGAQARGTPAISSDGTIYVTANDGRVTAVRSNGTVRWTYQTGGSLRAGSVVGGNGLVYVAAGDSLLYVLNPNGQVVGTFKTFDGLRAPPAIGADGRLYVGGRDRRFYVLREGGRALGQSPPDRLGGTLLRDPATDRVYVLVEGQRRHIPDPATLLTLGLTGRPVAATAVELARYPEGPPLPVIHEGSLLRSPHGPTYVVRDQQRVWIRSMAAFMAGGYRWDQVQTIEDRVMRSVPLAVEEGFLVKGTGPEVYVIEGGKRRWISTLAAFVSRGYTWDQVHWVNDDALQAIPLGAPLG